MGIKAVLDTNAVIYLQKGLLAEPLPVGEYFISVITEMELLSYPGLNETHNAWLRRFIDNIEVIEIEGEIKQTAINLRRQYRLKLPDAIIAASTISRKAILISNDQGMRSISGLEVRSLLLHC